MKRYFAVCLVLFLLISYSFLTVYTVKASNNNHINFTGLDDSYDVLAIKLALADLLKDCNEPIDENGKFSYSQTGASEIEAPDYISKREYEGNVSIEGKTLTEGESSRYAISGDIQFEISVFEFMGEESTEANVVLVHEDIYVYDGPFSICRERGRLYVGVDALDPEVDIEPGELTRLSTNYYQVPDSIRLTIDEEAYLDQIPDHFGYLGGHAIPMHEILPEIDIQLNLDQKTSGSYSWSYGQTPVLDLGYDISPEYLARREISLNDLYGTLNFSIGYTYVEGARIIIEGTWEYKEYRSHILYRTHLDPYESITARHLIGRVDDSGVNYYNAESIDVRFLFEQLGDEAYRSSSGQSFRAPYKIEPLSFTQIVEEANEPYTTDFSIRQRRYLTFSLNGEGLPANGLTTIIDTEASDTPGVMEVSVPGAIVVGLAGLAAAAGASAAGAAGASGAGAAGTSSSLTTGKTGKRRREDEEEDTESSYQMFLYKDFGNEIKADGETYYVYARMVEITPQGHEIDRDDLTRMIDIFASNNNIELSEPTISGNYMGVGVIAAPENQQIQLSNNRVNLLKKPQGSTPHSETVEITIDDTNQEAVVSFRFTGEGGIFQNNVTFHVKGDDWEIDADLRYNHDSDKIDLAIENQENNKATLQITEAAANLGEGHSNTSADIQVTAKNKTTEISRNIKTIIWQEGIFVTNVRQERNPDGSFTIKADGEQEKRKIQLQTIVWDEENQTAENKPELLNPENLQIELEPPNQETENILEVCELTYEHESTAHSFAVYDFYAKNELPVDGKDFTLPVKLSVKGQDPEIFTKQINFKIEPVNLEERSQERRIEIRRCNRIIDNHVPVAYRDQLREILDRRSQVLGPEGLYELRHKIWSVAQSLTLAEGAAGYKDVERWSNRIVNVLEWAEWAGEHCFNIVVKVKLGPKAVPAASLIRNMMIDSIKAAYYERLNPIDWLDRYVEQMYNSISIQGFMESGAEKGWKQFCDYLKERNIVIRGTGWSVTIPGWLAVKVLVAMRKFITEWHVNEKSLYEAAKATIWDTADGVIENYIENLLKEKGDYSLLDVADTEVRGDSKDSVFKKTGKESWDGTED